MSTDLNLDGPYSPEATLYAADRAAETIRYLNRATMHHEAIAFPSEADGLLRELSTMAGRLPQLLRQIGAWVNTEYEEGRIKMTGGEYPQAVIATLAVEARLEAASEYATLLCQMLNRAASVTSDMTVAEGGM
jgi:hypothetical protein